MNKIRAEASAVIQAKPEDVYAVLSDYVHEHPHILPEKVFSDLVVEAGGQGAGTVFRVRTHVMGTDRSFHMDVTEPEPGRVLAETDRLSDLVTTFTVEPVEGGQTRLTIASEWGQQPGVGGLLDRWLTPRLMRGIYADQLRQIEAYLMRVRAITDRFLIK